MWVGLKIEIADMFGVMEGCLGFADRADMRVIEDATPERREYRTEWARRQGDVTRAEKQAKRARAVEMVRAGVPKTRIARELGVDRMTVARWAA